LETLKWYFSGLTDEMFAFVAQISKLQRLELFQTELTAAPGMALLTKLKVLGIVGSKKLTDAALQSISELAASLEELTLNWGNGTHVTSVGCLSALSCLQTLSLTRCRWVTVDAFAGLSLPNLERLDLRQNDITGVVLAHLEPLPCLKVLNLSRCDELDNLTPDMNEKFPKLEELYLTRCFNLTNADLFRIAQLSSLRTLHLDGCVSITNLGLSHLLPLANNLTLLIVSSPHITDEGLVYIGSLSKLMSLSLTDCESVTDDGLRHLAPLTNLQHLYLCPTITRAGLGFLSSLKVAQLTVYGPRYWDQAGSEDVQQ